MSTVLLEILCPTEDRQLANYFPYDYWLLRYREMEVRKAPVMILEEIKSMVERLTNEHQ